MDLTVFSSRRKKPLTIKVEPVCFYAMLNWMGIAKTKTVHCIFVSELLKKHFGFLIL